MTFIEYILDPIKLITLLGLLGVVAIVYIETGLFVGFFLPGDSLLITAGLFAARGDIPITTLVVATTIAAILGDATGFYIGKKLGTLLYSKPDALFFKQKHLANAKAFYEKHGGKTIILGRFIPIIRTFVPTVAGAAEMKYLQFFAYNVIGGMLWVGTMCYGGYYLGQAFGGKINQYIHILIGGVIIISFIPIFIHWFNARKTAQKDDPKNGPTP